MIHLPTGRTYNKSHRSDGKPKCVTSWSRSVRGQTSIQQRVRMTSVQDHSHMTVEKIYLQLIVAIYKIYKVWGKILLYFYVKWNTKMR